MRARGDVAVVLDASVRRRVLEEDAARAAVERELVDRDDLELYDREVDPYQLQNVIGDPGYASVRDELATKLERLNGCAGKECNVKP